MGLEICAEHYCLGDTLGLGIVLRTTLPLLKALPKTVGCARMPLIGGELVPARREQELPRAESAQCTL